MAQEQTWGWIAPSPRCLTLSFDDLGDDARAHRLAAFPNGKVAAYIDSHRLIEIDQHNGVVAGHHHFLVIRQTDLSGDVRGLEEELRLVASEERSVPAA